MRGRGSLLHFSVGNQELEHGVAIASSSSWDTGVQVHAATSMVDATVAVTAGALSYPIWNDDNDRKRVSGRVAVRPLMGLVVGASGSRGPFLSQTAARGAAGDGREGDFTQTAFGGDVEYSRDHYIVRFESLFSGWTIPLAGTPSGRWMPTTGTPAVDVALRARATSLEGKYKIRPGLYAAARLDRLDFSEVAGTLGPETWDAPVTRAEIGGGYSLQRNLLLKVAYQYNVRDAGAVHRLGLVTGQLHFWF
jgi:predicted porin